jgi:hypothetical protein
VACFHPSPQDLTRMPPRHQVCNVRQQGGLAQLARCTVRGDLFLIISACRNLSLLSLLTTCCNSLQKIIISISSICFWLARTGHSIRVHQLRTKSKRAIGDSSRRGKEDHSTDFCAGQGRRGHDVRSWKDGGLSFQIGETAASGGVRPNHVEQCHH